MVLENTGSLWGVARGSASELRYQLTLARDLGYMRVETYEDFRSKTERISQMLTALSKSLSER